LSKKSFERTFSTELQNMKNIYGKKYGPTYLDGKLMNFELLNHNKEQF
jgi:hypothetical protein